MLTGKTIGQLTYLETPTADTLIPVELSGATYHIDFSSITVNGGGVIETTYSELYDKVTGGTLTIGSYYLITDFQTCYDQPDYDYNGNVIINNNNYRQGPIEPLIVFAISEYEISSTVYSTIHPNDKIQYDWSWDITEITNSPAKGRITERIDEYNNRTDYDHKSVKFKRYTSNILDSTIDGVIISMMDGTVTGLETTFTNLNVGQIIFIESNQPKFYKITNITSNTEMTVEGYQYSNFSNPDGYKCWVTYRRPKPGTPGTLYYFNDVGSGGDNYNISDGGDDMYDTANFINTSLSNDIVYTHTQMPDPPVDNDEQATIDDFIMDGTVQNGDSYFGLGSQYFTNLYPGLFVMVATGTTLEWFEINGDLGSDGNGQADLLDYTLSLTGVNGDYSVYCKRVWDAGDPSVNHIFIVNTIDENISHEADLTTFDDYDRISNLSGVTEIHYLLFGLAAGVKSTDEQIENVVLTYLSLVRGNDINGVLSILNSNYGDITSNLPPNDTGYYSFEYKQSNVLTDTGFTESPTFLFESEDIIGNYFGDVASLSEWDEYYFLLPNNVFGEDVIGNRMGNGFRNNSFESDVEHNIIGDNFANNTIYNDSDFIENQIATNFSNNFIICDDFNDNVIGDGFQNNNILDDVDFVDNKISINFAGNFISNDFDDNEIGNGFVGNTIFNQFEDNIIGNYFENNSLGTANNSQVFSDNRIGNNFNNNTITNIFDNNEIGSGFDNNSISGETYNNRIGERFEENTIYNYFHDNQISNEFKGNITYDSFYQNRIDYGFASNQISGDCSQNTFGPMINSNDFLGDVYQNTFKGDVFGNTIGNNFANNNIGFGFSDNTIGEDFGNGYNAPQGNTIGNYFIDNTIGEYFYNNTIADNFRDNEVGNYFQWNVINTNIDNIYFTLNYGNITGFSYTTAGTGATNNTYSGIQVCGTTQSMGVSASFNVEVSGGTVIGVTGATEGRLYQNDDELTILGTQIGGTTPEDDIVITVTGTTSGSSFYQHYTKQIFERRLGNKRVSFYDEDDILNVDSVYEISGYIPVYSQVVSFPLSSSSFEFECDGNYTNNGGITNQSAYTMTELVTLLNNNFRSFGYFFDNNDGTIGLYINPSLKQQYCPSGTYTINVFNN